MSKNVILECDILHNSWVFSLICSEFSKLENQRLDLISSMGGDLSIKPARLSVLGLQELIIVFFLWQSECYLVCKEVFWNISLFLCLIFKVWAAVPHNNLGIWIINEALRIQEKSCDKLNEKDAAIIAILLLWYLHPLIIERIVCLLMIVCSVHW